MASNGKPQGKWAVIVILAAVLGTFAALCVVVYRAEQRAKAGAPPAVAAPARGGG